MSNFTRTERVFLDSRSVSGSTYDEVIDKLVCYFRFHTEATRVLSGDITRARTIYTSLRTNTPTHLHFTDQKRFHIHSQFGDPDGTERSVKPLLVHLKRLDEYLFATSQERHSFEGEFVASVYATNAAILLQEYVVLPKLSMTPRLLSIFNRRKAYLHRKMMDEHFGSRPRSSPSAHPRVRLTAEELFPAERSNTMLPTPRLTHDDGVGTSAGNLRLRISRAQALEILRDLTGLPARRFMTMRTMDFDPASGGEDPEAESWRVGAINFHQSRAFEMAYTVIFGFAPNHPVTLNGQQMIDLMENSSVSTS